MSSVGLRDEGVATKACVQARSARRRIVGRGRLAGQPQIFAWRCRTLFKRAEVVSAAVLLSMGDAGVAARTIEHAAAGGAKSGLVLAFLVSYS